MSNERNTNPFVFAATESEQTQSRKLDYTPQLIAISNNRAAELMKEVSKRPELHDLANRVLDDCEASDLIELLETVYDEQTIAEDAEFLEGASDEMFDRLLKSRQSDRSKAKTKGPRSNVRVCQTYMAAMYAELLIRKAWNKPYNASNSSLESADFSEDADARERRIKSLQSKKCRLAKLAGYDQSAKQELEEVQAEIDRLVSLRPNAPKVAGKVVIKNDQLPELRKVLESIDPTTLEDKERIAYEQLLAKLG